MFYCLAVAIHTNRFETVWAHMLFGIGPALFFLVQNNLESIRFGALCIWRFSLQRMCQILPYGCAADLYRTMWVHEEESPMRHRSISTHTEAYRCVWMLTNTYECVMVVYDSYVYVYVFVYAHMYIYVKMVLVHGPQQIYLASLGGQLMPAWVI